MSNLTDETNVIDHFQKNVFKISEFSIYYFFQIPAALVVKKQHFSIFLTLSTYNIEHWLIDLSQKLLSSICTNYTKYLTNVNLVKKIKKKECPCNTDTEAARCEKRLGENHMTGAVFTAAPSSGCRHRSCFAAAAVGKLAKGQAKCYTAQC